MLFTEHIVQGEGDASGYFETLKVIRRPSSASSLALFKDGEELALLSSNLSNDQQRPIPHTRHTFGPRSVIIIIRQREELVVPRPQ